MRIPILMPQLGESVVEATVVSIGANVGDTVTGDQEIIEVETNKAILHVTAPAPGEVVELRIEPQTTYAVGTVLGYLEVAPADAERLGLSPTDDHADGAAAAPKIESQRANGVTLEMPEVEPGTETLRDNAPARVRGGNHGGQTERRAAPPVPAGLPASGGGGSGFLSPRVRARLAELNLQTADLAAVAGSGAGGRLTAEDVEKFVAGLEAGHPQPASALRLAVADAMRRSWTRPLATVGRPIALDAVLAHRGTFPEEGPRPGIALYAGRALALALAQTDHGASASRLIGGRWIKPASLDIAFAVEIGEGVLTPTLRSVDRTPLREMAAPYAEMLDLARQRRLSPEAMAGAAATVTNYGPFGLTWATPIPLPDQTLILGLAAARKTPSWDESRQQFVPVTEAEFTLSFDHRSLDGGAAGRLLGAIAKLLAAPEKL